MIQVYMYIRQIDYNNTAHNRPSGHNVKCRGYIVKTAAIDETTYSIMQENPKCTSSSSKNAFIPCCLRVSRTRSAIWARERGGGMMLEYGVVHRCTGGAQSSLWTSEIAVSSMCLPSFAWVQRDSSVCHVWRRCLSYLQYICVSSKCITGEACVCESHKRMDYGSRSRNTMVMDERVKVAFMREAESHVCSIARPKLCSRRAPPSR